MTESIFSKISNDNKILITHITEFIGQNVVDKHLAVEKTEIEVMLLVFLLDSL
jgi:hypothetical protein